MRPRWLVLAATLVLCGSLSFGVQQEEGQEEDAKDFQSEGDYRKGMQDIDHSFGDLLEERERFWLEPDTQRNAARLTDLFHRVETFWKGRGDEEAAGFARLAREGAERAQEASRMRDEKAFDAAVDSIASSCAGCHAEASEKFRLRP